MTARTVIKTLVERGAVLSGAARVSRRRRSDQTLILAYHNIVPHGADPTGDRSLHLPQAAFVEQLEQLSRTHEIVPLADILSEGMPRGDRPRAAITFDDAYCGAVTAGVQELRARGLPATIFVTPAFVGGQPFWWDVLTPVSAAGLDDRMREAALSANAGKDAVIREWARHTGVALRELREVPQYARCATLPMLEQALSHLGITFGSHTWSHPNLTQLTPEELREELEGPLRWLSIFGDRTLPIVSYPYGRANATVWDATRDAGYTAGFMIDGGWLGTSSPTTRYALPRVNIPAGVSLDGFVLRTSGLLSA